MEKPQLSRVLLRTERSFHQRANSGRVSWSVDQAAGLMKPPGAPAVVPGVSGIQSVDVW